MKIIPLLFISLFTVACSQDSEFYARTPAPPADSSEEPVKPVTETETKAEEKQQPTEVQPTIEYPTESSSVPKKEEGVIQSPLSSWSRK
jgi:hypothetical protein